MLPGKWLLSGSGQTSHGIKFVLLLFSLLLLCLHITYLYVP